MASHLELVRVASPPSIPLEMTADMRKFVGMMSRRKIGKYYYDNPVEHTNGEFDVVTEDENGYIFYEVKFKKTPVTDEIIEKEISQVEATGLNCYKYVFISRSGFSCQQRITDKK